VKQTGGKRRRWRKAWYVTVLTLVFLVFSCQSNVQAVELGTVQCSREVKKVDSKERRYHMELKVWTEMSDYKSHQPQDIILLLENSYSMSCLAQAPDEDDTVYQKGIPTLHKISASQTLYTEVEGEYLPVVLNGNQWQLLTGKANDGTVYGEVVGTRDPLQGDIFTQDVFEKSECPTRMEQAKEAAKQLIRQTAEFLPGSRIGLLFFGKSLYSANSRELTESGVQSLLKEISDFGNEFGEGYCYAEALSKVQEMIEELQITGQNPCSLITITAGEAGSEKKEDPSGVTAAAASMQVLREQGVKSHVLLMGSGKSAESDWSALCSAPLENHYRECFQGQLLEEMDRLFRHIADSTTVSVVQALDTRFQLTEKEYARLSQEEVSVIEKENGETLIAWEAELPYNSENPWKTELEFEAKKDFPGGNDVGMDGEESGIYWGEKQISKCPDMEINVPIRISLKDIEDDIFLGEKVKTTLLRQNVEEKLLGNLIPNWYGKGETGTISYSWKRTDGSTVGSLKQLAEIRPVRDQEFLFAVTYTPKSQGNNAVGVPVQQTYSTGNYTVHVVSGTVSLEVLTDRLSEEGGMPVFSLEKDDTTFYRTARLSSQEKEESTLFVDFAGLPYGKYRLKQINPFYNKIDQECWLGICSKDDTLDLGRNVCDMEIKLTATPSEAGELNYSVDTYGEVFRVESGR